MENKFKELLFCNYCEYNAAKMSQNGWCQNCFESKLVEYVEKSALESANAENKELTDEITALKKELKSKNDSYSDRLNKYWQNHTSIEGFKKELADENAKVTKILNWLVFHAIDTASISKAKGAELLGIPLIDMDNYRNSLDMK